MQLRATRLASVAHAGARRLIPVLDQLSAPAAAAFSVRRIKRDYAGAALRARRSFDGAESDVGFIGDDLDTTALLTFVGSQNLLLHSDGLFTSPWIAGPAHTRSANADVAPDGTTTATLITNTNSSTGNFTYQLQSTVTGQRTFSVYGKAGTNRYLWVYGGINTTANYGALFDLQDGVFVLDRVNGSVTGASASIQSVGNGWFRCSITHTQATSSYVAVTATNNTSPTFSANNDITNCTAGTVLVWGAQFNQGTLQPYSTTTRRNLLTFTESFENAVWEGLSGSAETIAVNTELAPDGTMTADRCTVIGGNSGRYQQITLSSAGQITFSTHIKVGSLGTWARVGIYDTATPGNQARCWVNMETGELGTVSIVGTGWSNVTATSTNAGNGYYRVSVTATCTATAISVLVANANDNDSTVRTTGHNRILWGAQLESGSLTPYQGVASAWPVTRDGNGFMAVWYDQGRYAHAVRRNLLTFTEEFDNAIWPATGVTITANNAAAPDSLNSAETIVETATSGVHRFQRGTGTLTAGLPVSLSVYVRRGAGARQFQLGISGGGLVARAYFDLNTGTVGQIDQCTASIQTAGAFYRVSLTATPLTTGAHSAFLAITPTTTIGSETYTGDGTSSVVIWGAQLEIGSSVTEYQPILTGIALNATQTTAANQPAIVTGGVMVTLNNRPAVDFSGTKWLFNTEVSSNAALWGNNPQTMNMIGSSSVITDRDAFSLLGGAATTTNLRSIGGSPGTAWRYTTGTDAVAAAPTADLSVVTGDYADSVTNIYTQGVLRDTKSGSENTTAGNLTIGARTSAGAIPWLGLGAEFTLFASVLSAADRRTLERNQGSYFGITVA